MLGNSIGPAINFKLKILPLPTLVDTPESTPSKRIFKFDCAVPDAQIKYEISNYVCKIDNTEPTNLYTTNQTFTADRPKKIKLIASKAGYKSSKLQILDLTIKPYLDVGLRVGWNNSLYINNINYDYYIDCSTTTSTGRLSVAYKLADSTSSTNKWVSVNLTNTLAQNTLYFSPSTFSQPLSVRISLPENKDAGYLSGGEMIYYVKPYYPRPVITQSFSGRPATVTITKTYETSVRYPNTTYQYYLRDNGALKLNDNLYQSLTSASKDTGKIYYTLDGSTPTINSNLYTDPFTVTNDTVVKALVLDDKRNGTLAAAYINVGQIQYTGLNQKATYTTGANVSAITILKANGGKGGITTCVASDGSCTPSSFPTVMGMRYNGGVMGRSCTSGTLKIDSGVSGKCLITKININSTKTYSITAGKDSTLNTTSLKLCYSYNTDHTPSIIRNSDNTILSTGNIYDGNMDDLFVTNYMLSGMKLHQIITQPWVWGISSNNNILNEYNYDLDLTINDEYLNSKIYNAYWFGSSSQISTRQGPKLIPGPGVYIIEHYSN